MVRLLLLSNSTVHGAGYLDHAMSALREHLADARTLAFVPFALADHAGYTAKVRERFAAERIEVRGLTPDEQGVGALHEADAVFVGGGNTFRLLDKLHRSGLLIAIRERVRSGMPYVGSSAGSNVAAPTIKTTNDMPIVQPPSFEALNLIPFQMNPHYLDPDPGSRHMGETREQRIIEFLEENTTPVLGLREGGWLRVRGTDITLEAHTARLFRRGRAPEELAPGTRIDEVLAR